ncbi:MAG: 50S ribosomal protein L25 [Phycisphaeraceae bacterium]
MATTTIPKIKVHKRERTGSRYAARLREKGQLPAVVYGHGQEPLHVSLDAKEMDHLLHQHTHILEVEADGKTEPCLIKDVQWDHLGSTVVHVDLARVDLSESVTVEVDLVLVGEAPGLKETGAILEHPVAVIEIECLATQIPQNIKVDVSALNAGDVITVADLKLPEGVTTTLDEDTVLATVTIVQEAVEEVIAPAAGGEEPEVIGRKPEEGEGEGEAAAGGAKPAAGAKTAAGAKPAAAAPKGDKK